MTTDTIMIPVDDRVLLIDLGRPDCAAAITIGYIDDDDQHEVMPWVLLTLDQVAVLAEATVSYLEAADWPEDLYERWKALTDHWLERSRRYASDEIDKDDDEPL
jgi:hypothetical protein